ncbi:helix-turn-helix domain-containing protein [Paraburkholderia xenovorans]|uniref:helix-turn-helix domain-containing protein n=1 Tax=Paraburkholderia xenovorans TaxID=36873 RepID=UPI0038B777DC
MQSNNPVIEPDRFNTAATHHTAAVIPSQTITAPAFLSMPNWTVDETADFLRCQAQTIRKAISQKGNFHDLKPYRFGRRWYFRAADVRSMLEAA